MWAPRDAYTAPGLGRGVRGGAIARRRTTWSKPLPVIPTCAEAYISRVNWP